MLAKKTTTGTPPHHTATRCTLHTPKKSGTLFLGAIHNRHRLASLCREERHTPAYKLHRQTLWSAVERDHTRARILNRNDQDLVPLGDDVCGRSAPLTCPYSSFPIASNVSQFLNVVRHQSCTGNSLENTHDPSSMLTHPAIKLERCLALCAKACLEGWTFIDCHDLITKSNTKTASVSRTIFGVEEYARFNGTQWCSNSTCAKGEGGSVWRVAKSHSRSLMYENPWAAAAASGCGC